MFVEGIRVMFVCSDKQWKAFMALLRERRQKESVLRGA